MKSTNQLAGFFCNYNVIIWSFGAFVRNNIMFNSDGKFNENASISFCFCRYIYSCPHTTNCEQLHYGGEQMWNWCFVLAMAQWQCHEVGENHRFPNIVAEAFDLWTHDSLKYICGRESKHYICGLMVPSRTRPY